MCTWYFFIRTAVLVFFFALLHGKSFRGRIFPSHMWKGISILRGHHFCEKPGLAIGGCRCQTWGGDRNDWVAVVLITKQWLKEESYTFSRIFSMVKRKFRDGSRDEGWINGAMTMRCLSWWCAIIHKPHRPKNTFVSDTAPQNKALMLAVLLTSRRSWMELVGDPTTEATSSSAHGIHLDGSQLLPATRYQGLILSSCSPVCWKRWTFGEHDAVNNIHGGKRRVKGKRV